MLVAFFWLVFCVVVGVIARSRGRDGFWWFLLSLFLSPVLMLILVMCMDRAEAKPAAPDRTGSGDLVTGRMLRWAIVIAVAVVVLTVVFGRALVG